MSARQLKTRQRSLGPGAQWSVWCVFWPDTCIVFVNAIKPDAGACLGTQGQPRYPWCLAIKNISVNKKISKVLDIRDQVSFAGARNETLFEVPLQFLPAAILPSMCQVCAVDACGYLKNSTSWNPTLEPNGPMVHVLCYDPAMPHSEEHYKYEQMPPICNVHSNWGGFWNE